MQTDFFNKNDIHAVYVSDKLQMFHVKHLKTSCELYVSHLYETPNS